MLFLLTTSHTSSHLTSYIHHLMKIFAVGMNYPWHNKDDNNTLLNNGLPVFYTKPDSTLLRNGKPFFVPNELGRVEGQAELVVRINRLGKGIPERFAHRYYDAFTVGVNFVAVDVLQRLRSSGLPWDAAVVFDQSAAIGEWVPKDQLPPVQDLHFSLDINGQRVQEGCTAQMVHSVDALVAHISRYMTLRTGDILFTGTPSPATTVAIDDHIDGTVDVMGVLHFNVK